METTKIPRHSGGGYRSPTFVATPVHNRQTNPCPNITPQKRKWAQARRWLWVDCIAIVLTLKGAVGRVLVKFFTHLLKLFAPHRR